MMKTKNIIFLTVIYFIGITGCDNKGHNKNTLTNTNIDTIKRIKQQKIIDVKKDNHKRDSIRFKSNTQMDSDMAFYQYVHKNINKISNKEIKRLVDTIDSYYNQNNASFDEYNPTILYFVLIERTQDLLQCLSQIDTSMLNNWILPILSDPVYPEKFDVAIHKVKNARCAQPLKEKVIKAIEEGKNAMQ